MRIGEELNGTDHGGGRQPHSCPPFSAGWKQRSKMPISTRSESRMSFGRDMGAGTSPKAASVTVVHWVDCFVERKGSNLQTVRDEVLKQARAIVKR